MLIHEAHHQLSGCVQSDAVIPLPYHVITKPQRSALCCRACCHCHTHNQADCLADPSTVFLYLQDHNIGRDHALLYEAYAAYLELKGNFTQADLVYQEGINRSVSHVLPV